MSLIHQVLIGEDERKYFRFTGGSPREIEASEYQNTGVYASLLLLNEFNESATGGEGWLNSSAQTIDVLYLGTAVKNLRGSASGLMSWPDGTSINVTLATHANAGDPPAGSPGESSGDGTFAESDDYVLPPFEPDPPSDPPALPQGNGNFGFQGSGSSGVELGITGGNS
jgi:hypothetical protein